MERYCSTGQSPQRAVAPPEEEYDIIAVCACRSPSGSFNQFLYLPDLKVLHMFKARFEFIFSRDINVNLLMDRNTQRWKYLLFDNMFNVMELPVMISGGGGEKRRRKRRIRKKKKKE
jgi:hypothetical protein